MLKMLKRSSVLTFVLQRGCIYPNLELKEKSLKTNFYNHLIFHFSYWLHFFYSWNRKVCSSTHFSPWFSLTYLPNTDLMVTYFKNAHSCFESSIPFIFSLIKIQPWVIYVFPFAYFCFKAPNIYHLSDKTLPVDFSVSFSMRTTVFRHFEDRDCVSIAISIPVLVS